MLDDFLKSRHKELKTFKEFEVEIEKINQFYRELKVKKRTLFSPVLYRGQTDSGWKLKTTLERVSNFPVRMDEYYRKVRNIWKEVEIFTDTKWDLDFDKIDFSKRPWESLNLPMYEFMVYLRHHSFPSPLLDWTESPYIAAFFAFSDIAKIESSIEAADRRVAIFVLIEDTGEGKSGWEDASQIESLGPNIGAHKRHYFQQCWYTICIKRVDNIFYYVSHEDVFERKSEHQDIWIKYSIPLSELDEALKRLNSMNINAYSLFGSNESLMHHLAVKSFVPSQYK